MNNILLDLDQTLIAALSPEELDEKKHSKKMQKFKYYNMDQVTEAALAEADKILQKLSK